MDNLVCVTNSTFEQITSTVKKACELHEHAQVHVNALASHVELEAAIKRQIDIVEFMNALRYLTNQGLPMEEHDVQLDVSFVNVTLPKSHPSLVGVRASVIRRQSVIEYAHHNDFAKIPMHALRIIRKSRHHAPHIDLPGYDIRISLRMEDTCTMGNFDAKILRTSPKLFRLKNRFSFLSNDGMFRYDLTRVYASSGMPTNIAMASLQLIAPTYEMEVELINFNSNHERIANGLLQHIAFLQCVATQSPSLSNKIDLHNVLNAYQRHEIRAPQPKTLTHAHLVEGHRNKTILSGYTVTDKADGERHQLYICSTGRVYLLPRPPTVTNIKDLGLTCSDLAETILDGEWIYNKASAIYAGFDVYVFKNKNMRADMLENRLAALQDAAKLLASAGVPAIAKTFYFAEGHEILHQCKRIYDESENGNIGYRLDGLIFTPTGHITKNIEVFKWKPPEQNSIDFLVVWERKSKTSSTFALYCKGGSSYTISISKYLDDGDALLHSNKLSMRPVLFHPNPYMTVAHDTYAQCENGDIIENRSIVECYYNAGWRPMRVRFDKVQDMQRTKKITANSLETALSVYDSIINPLTYEQLTGNAKVPVRQASDVYYNRTDDTKGTAAHLRKFHNTIIKQCLLLGQASDWVQEPRLLDVGCAKGGDVYKWEHLGFKEVLGVDPVEDNLINSVDGAYKRLMELKKRTGRNLAYVFLPIDATKPFSTLQDAKCALTVKTTIDALWQTQSKKHFMFAGFAKKPFDVVSIQFAIHYFFSKPSDLATLCATIAAMTRPGSIVVGTCLDGIAVDTAFQKRAVLQGNDDTGKVMWRIEKQYADDQSIAEHKPNENYGKTISVYFASINTVVDEWLVDTRELVNVMDDHGFEQLPHFGPDSSFAAVYADTIARPDHYAALGKLNDDAIRTTVTSMKLMSEAEREYSFLHMWFAFRKR